MNINVNNDLQTNIKGIPSGLYLPFLQRLSYAKKSANNFFWVERMADFFDWHYMMDYTAEQKKFRINSDLFNGRGNEEDYLDADTIMALQEEGFEVGSQKIRHHDILSNVANSLHGDLIKRPFSPSAFDVSAYNSTVRSAKHDELLLRSVQQNILDPMKQEIQMQWAMEHQVEDLFSLKPEEQQQMESDIAQRMDVQTPSEIKKFMDKVYKSPSEREAQKLLNYFIKEQDVLYKRNENFKNFIASGRAIFCTELRNKRVTYDMVNPVGFYYEMSKNKIFIQHADWCKYETYTKYTDIFTNYGTDLSLQDVKDLEKMYSGFVTSGIQREPEYGKVVAEISANPHAFMPENINIRTRMGQEQWQESYQHAMSSRGNSISTVRNLHIVYTSLRKLKYIKRLNGKKDEVTGFWVDETYQFNRANGDVEESVTYVPQKFQCNKIGFSTAGTAIYIRKGPLPYQYTSVNNPFSCELPYVGIDYGRFQGNSKPVAPIDKGKPWQYKFNVHMARIEAAEESDVGRVLLFLMKAKPANWSLAKFISVVKKGKFVPLDLEGEGLNPSDMQVFKEINLSNSQEIQNKLQYLEFLKNQATYAMSYNPSRLGQISPYMTATNNQQSILQSLSQTEDLYSTYNKVVEMSLTALLRTAKVALKDDKIQRTNILDDLSVQNIEIDWECLAYSEMQVFVSNTGEDYDNMITAKNEAKTMIQNGLITYPEFIKLNWAKSGAEVISLAEEAQKRREKEMQAAAENEQKQQQAMLEHQKEIEKMRQEFELLKLDKEIQAKIMGIEIDSRKFANQFDINQNQINDQSENNDKNLQFKYDELKVKKELEEKKIKAIEKQKAIGQKKN